MKNKNFLFSIGLMALFCVGCKKSSDNNPRSKVFQASGNIAAQLEQFRTALGTLNTAPGATSGRREINWDAVPDNLLDKPLPGDLFNPTGTAALLSMQRGLEYGEAAFQVSATNFVQINAEAATEFSAFSGTKVFANTTASSWPIGFEVAGENTTASVAAFGAVFSDVDKEGSTRISFFDGAENLGSFAVPAKSAESNFSFLGVQFLNRKITKVVVAHEGMLAGGQKDISQGGPNDLIVLDDFIYSEPVRLQQ